MKKSLFILLLGLILTSCDVFFPHLTFKGVPIDGPVALMHDTLQTMGFTAIDETTLKGSFADYDDCTIELCAKPQSDDIFAVKVGFPNIIVWEDVEEQYEHLSTMLIAKYGEPVRVENEVPGHLTAIGKRMFLIEEGPVNVTYFEARGGDICLQIERNNLYVRCAITYLDFQNIPEMTGVKDL